ncbi:MAG: sulfatase [Verrucomicrobiota bacterium]
MKLPRLLRVFGLLALACAALARAADTRPNFVFIYADDQRYDALSVVQQEQGEKGRYPWFKTPHMDRIAAEGVRFRNAFVTLALCAPSRAAFLTGRYNHLNGVIDNYTPFPVDNVTHASVLRAAGYATAYIGKWHMGTQSGQRPGFSYSASYVGQGKYFDGPFEIDGVSTPTKGWVDDVATDYALDFIKRQPRDKPFSLVLGFKTPHVPLDPPPRAKERFTGEEWHLVPSMHDRAIYRDPPAANAAPNAKRATPINYFRCVSAIDDNVGRVLALLDELGLTENTLIVYSSDNGYLHGEHSLGDKRCAYDESIRIPLVARFPKRFPKGKVIDEMVLNLDLAPTYLDLAGVKIPAEMQGRSMVPLATAKPGARPEWRRAFFYEYFLEKQYPQTPTVFAVRTDTAKLVKYPGRDDWTELFDLKADPYEMKNLARDPAHAALLKHLEAQFTREQAAVAFRVPEGAGAK